MIDSSYIIPTLAQYGFLRGSLKRRIKEQINATVVYGHAGSLDAKAGKILYFCLATKERWPEQEVLISESIFDIAYAKQVLGFGEPLCGYWADYLTWERVGKGDQSDHTLDMYGDIERRMKEWTV